MSNEQQDDLERQGEETVRLPKPNGKRQQAQAGEIASEPGPTRRTRRLRIRGHRLRDQRGVVKRATTLRMDWNSYELLKLHAFQRHVTVSVLMNDILDGWLAVATDYRQEVVRQLLPGARHRPVPERYAGYLASLGFDRKVVQRTAQDEAAFPHEPYAAAREATQRAENALPPRSVQRAQPSAPLTHQPEPDAIRPHREEDEHGA